MSKVDFLYNTFCHRKDAYCLMTPHPWQRDASGRLRENYYERVYAPLTKELIEKHLAGKITLGVFPTELSTQTVKFLCFDVDDIREEYLVKAFFWAKQIHSNILIEKSGAPDRYHVWVLFDKAISLKEARSYFIGKDQTGMDFFPNQDKVTNDFYYELPIKLPLGYHQKAKNWSCFVNDLSILT